jgi:hypothetical protein
MEWISTKNNGLCEKKIRLMEMLLHCVKQERENLIQLDVESLWGIMEEKDQIMRALEETQLEIDREAEGQEMHGRQGEGKAWGEEARKVALLKQEIRARVNENVSFIQETLGFMDEVVSSFTSGNSTDQTYRPVSRAPQEPTPMIYHREV